MLFFHQEKWPKEESDRTFFLAHFEVCKTRGLTRTERRRRRGQGSDWTWKCWTLGAFSSSGALKSAEKSHQELFKDWYLQNKFIPARAASRIICRLSNAPLLVDLKPCILFS